MPGGRTYVLGRSAAIEEICMPSASFVFATLVRAKKGGGRLSQAGCSKVSKK